MEGSNVSQLLRKSGVTTYEELVKKSLVDYSWFWGNLPDWLGLRWERKFTQLLDSSAGPEWTSWYVGGLINLEEQLLEDKSGVALIWVPEVGPSKELTYQDLARMSSRFAGFLTSQGVGEGDVVTLYAPMIPEVLAAMFGTFRVGAIASPVFSGYGASALAERLRGTKVLVTVDGYYRRGEVRSLKGVVDSVVSDGVKVVVVERLRSSVEMKEGRDFTFREVLEYGEQERRYVDPNHPALLMYTSGTTGRPKGVLISHAGAALEPAKEQRYNFDLKPGDRLWWVSDIGWMMGPWQVIGSQVLGATHLVVEGAIDYPSKHKLWDVVRTQGVTHLGFAATVARMLKGYGAPESIPRHLKVFGNTGEPIDEDTWRWVMEVGEWKRPLINISGGTEVFGCILGPSVLTPLKPSTLWGPCLGVDADVVDDEGRSVRGKVGYLVIRRPIPSMTRGFYGDRERYLETYWYRFYGIWYHGDLAYVDEEGYWFLRGRADDVIKVAGKRVGPAELETVLNSHPAILESACVGVPDSVKGEVIYCFVKPRASSVPLGELSDLVANTLGRPFVPEKVYQVRDLPRTRSGKIMRRVIKAAVTGGPLGDLTSLENPDSVQEIKKIFER
ncbi:AMP-dependent synthetase [Sulfodiicoccus acidiphilus]|uniref:acetate--CoA ligase n=1 Tax=Sulfodiicoccus acidiphilus TaxID=1670455 RepID=A0A348B461_9CREN|nr:AMP-dependent synthetase [Sulfodiicoccus acidiphilus]GGT87684.1 AMP-dependent synthetase [Sulfodiicoccus acidiphilus]